MYIVRSKYSSTICFSWADALEKYYWRLGFSEFVEIVKAAEGGKTEQVRRSW